MNNKIIFLLIVLASSFIGIFIATINNNIILEKQDNLLKNDNNNVHKEDNKNILPEDIKPIINETDKNNNQIIKINDFINEDDEEQNNKTDDKNIEDKNKNIENKEKEQEKTEQKKIEQEKAEQKKKEQEKTEQKKKEQETKIDNKGINYIHIGFSLDNKYIYPLLVCLTSVLENRAKTTFYIFHIQTSKNLNKQYFDKINNLIERYGKEASNITYYNMGDDFRGAITGTHISTAAYYRIALPSLLPNVDKIIYTDTDVLNFKDLLEMYNLQFKEKKYFMGTLDQVGLLNELKQLGIYTQKYMNSGILLMNLKGMREDGIEQRIRKFIFSHYLDHHDQTAINGACYDNYEILSFKYATFAFNSLNAMKEWNNKQNKLYRYNDYELNQAFYEPILLHFAGWTKPWDKSYKNDLGIYWWYFAKKSGFYDEILKNYNFDKNTIEKKLEKIPEDGGLLKRNYKKFI